MPQAIVSDLISQVVSNPVTIGITVVVGIISYYSSKRGIENYVSSANENKLEQGREQLLRILEGKLIDGARINPAQMDNLIAAVDREHSVELSKETDRISILEDLELRIEDSRHLSREQKKEYVEEITNAIEAIKEIKYTPSISVRFGDVFQDIREKLNDDNEKLHDDINELENYVTNVEQYHSTSGDFQQVTSIISFIISGIIVVTLISVLTDGILPVFSNGTSALPSAMLFFAAIIGFLYLYANIISRR